MKKVVLFDFDGTLVDSETCILACFEHLFDLYSNKELFTHQLQEEVLGPPLDVMIKNLFPHEDTKALIEEYRRYQVEEAAHLIVCMPHCIEVLKRFKQEGILVGIVSTRKQESLYFHMNRLGMCDLVDVVVGGDLVEFQKPSPEGINQALQQLNIQEKDAVMYVGDNAIDVQAGKNAGVTSVAKLGHLGKVEKIQQANPDAMVEDLIELLPLVL